MRSTLFRSLYFQVVVALVAGVAVGHFYPAIATDLKPLGDVFINGIKMVITPVIFCTIVSGIAGMENLKKVGRVGGKAVLYFELVTTLALVIGMVVANIVQPGAGINADIASLDKGAVAAIADKAHPQTTLQFITSIVPSSVVDSFAKGNLLQVLLFSALFGVSLSVMGERGRKAREIVDEFGKALLGVVGLVMKLAPIGAFGAMAFTVGKFGIGTLQQLATLIGAYYLTTLLFVFVVLGTIAKVAGVSLWKLIKYLKEEMFIVLGTASTESVLPQLMQKLEAMGVKRTVVGMVVPTGYSFNLDGAAIYLTMTSLFIAQALNIDLSLWQQLGLLAILLLTSKGGAGVAGAALVALAATLGSTHILPVAGIALVIGVDRLMNEIRALTNLVGNAVAAIVVARWEGELDLQRARAVLNGDIVPVLDVDVEPQVDQELQPRPVAVPVTKPALA
ncbi:C4-dicarboxylate transporter DctA [Massilia solisilvae]|uniref:C4-dicarboxylate transporter DctA n=1 Tax=Massilia solisilvae TaxID=1811225 RepID=A0ABT2BKR0_9BURK|nr:C4-dicarboxylate transporter DctA [Massilia solisilvae]MCS0609094.1 C4-dicarboxylate transporter DctA [Massilia solisilvae]